MKAMTASYLREQAPKLMGILHEDLSSWTLSRQQMVEALLDSKNLVEQLESEIHETVTTLATRLVKEIYGYNLHLDAVAQFNANYVVACERYDDENNIRFPTSLLYAQEAEICAYIDAEKDKERLRKLEESKRQKDEEIEILKQRLQRLQTERDKLS